MATKPPTNSFLPIEIIFQILSLLSPESLLRCRTVCKQWLSLISDHRFIQTHLKLSTTNTRTHRVIFISRTTLALKSFSVRTILHEPCLDTIDRGNSSLAHRNWARVVGSCNGLVCITSHTYALSIWNPSTRRSRRLIVSRPENARRIVYGFGYDESSDEYKTVIIHERVVGIYSLKANSWKRISDFPELLLTKSSGKFVSGALHWAATRAHDSSIRVIVSLDLQTESYGEVLQPNYGEGGARFEVGVLGGCLSMVREFYESRVDIWVMKEYGVRESWTKLASISYLAEPLVGSTTYWNPLCVLDNEEILLDVKNRLVMYNPRENKLKYLDIQDYDAGEEVYMYVESMISPTQFD